VVEGVCDLIWNSKGAHEKRRQKRATWVRGVGAWHKCPPVATVRTDLTPQVCAQTSPLLWLCAQTALAVRTDLTPALARWWLQLGKLNRLNTFTAAASQLAE